MSRTVIDLPDAPPEVRHDSEASNTMLSAEQRLVLETNARRDRAEAVLQSLLLAKAECEKQLARFRRPDMMKSVTGKSALDAAIASTQRMVESLNRTLSEARRGQVEDGFSDAGRMGVAAQQAAIRGSLNPSTGRREPRH